jgi:hypothetical protein
MLRHLRTANNLYGAGTQCSSSWPTQGFPTRARGNVQFEGRVAGALQDLLFRLRDLSIGLLLDARDFVSRISRRQDQFIDLQLHGRRIPVLGRLNQEDHQERDNGRAGVDNELPGVAEAE